MATMFVRHTVADYKAWRKVYDELAPIGKDHGVTNAAVYQAADNPNDVTVTHDFSTVEEARKFAAADGLKDAMAKAGVIGAPTIWFASRA
jgi:hypothetical protein